MKSRSQPKVVELDVQQLEANLDEIERVMGAETVRPFRLLLEWYLSLLRLIQEKNIRIARLRRLLFGPRTERTQNVVATDETKASTAPSDERRQPPLDDG